MSKKATYLYRWDLLFLKIRRIIRSHYRIESDIKYWKTLKGKHIGRPGFVIGNGPSLTMDDLSKISDKGFISIASNKISLAFKETKWRPDYYTIADPLVWNKINKNIDKDIKIVHVPAHFDDKNCNIEVKSWKPLINNFEKELCNISDDVSKGVVGGCTVTYENIQIALHLGLNPIYVIGCDHYYAGENDVKAGQEIYESDHQNHFIKGYRKAGEKVYAAPIDEMTAAYEIARLYSDKKNVEIYNATRGGHLEVFKRTDLDTVLR